MHSLSLSFPLLLPSPSRLSPHHLQLQCSYFRSIHNHHLGRHSIARCSTSVPPYEGTVPVMNFEDFVDKDWSFLECDDSSLSEEYHSKICRITNAGEIGETSRILVSIGSEGFVDQLVESSPCQLLLVAHDSLFTLACIKEKYDKVKCWQGEIIYLPDKWSPFDVVFLYFLPALPFSLEQVFQELAKRCSQGARVVICHPQGREMLQKQRKQYSDVVVSDLPDKTGLQKAATNHSFDIAEYVDEDGFYLAVLRFSGARS